MTKNLAPTPKVTLSLDKDKSTPSNHEDEPIIDKVDIASTQKDSPATRQDEGTLSLDKHNSTPRNPEDEPINTDSPKLCNDADETITETAHNTERITTNTDDCSQPAVENNVGKRKLHDPIMTVKK